MSSRVVGAGSMNDRKWPQKGEKKMQAPPPPSSTKNQISQRQEHKKKQEFCELKKTLESLYDRIRLVKLRQNEANSKLGFSLRGGKESTGSSVGVFVSHVEPASEADLKGLKIGDQLIQVNGLNVHEATYEEVIGLIKRTPKCHDILLRVNNLAKIPFQEKSGDPIKWLGVLDLLESQQEQEDEDEPFDGSCEESSSSSSTSSESYEINASEQDVELEEEQIASTISATKAQSLSSDEGIIDGGESCASEGPSNNSLSSCSEEEKSDGEKNRKQKTVLMVTPTENYDSALSSGSASFMSSSGGGLNKNSAGQKSSYCSCPLSVCSSSSPQEVGRTKSNRQLLPLPADILVRVPGGRRTSESFGCGVVKGPDEWPGIFVQNVKPGSLAERVGLEPGDQLTKADGQLLVELSFDAAIKLIKRLQQEQDELRLYVKKGAALKYLATNRQHQQQQLKKSERDSDLRKSVSAGSDEKGANSKEEDDDDDDDDYDESGLPMTEEAQTTHHQLLEQATTTTKCKITSQARPTTTTTNANSISTASGDVCLNAISGGTQNQLSGNNTQHQHPCCPTTTELNYNLKCCSSAPDSIKLMSSNGKCSLACREEEAKRARKEPGEELMERSMSNSSNLMNKQRTHVPPPVESSSSMGKDCAKGKDETTSIGCCRVYQEMKVEEEFECEQEEEEDEEEEIRIVNQNCKLHQQNHKAAHKKLFSHVHERFPHPAAKCEQERAVEKQLQFTTRSRPSVKAPGTREKNDKHSVDELRRQLDQRAARLSRLAVMQQQQQQQKHQLQRYTSMDNLSSTNNNSRQLYLHHQQQQAPSKRRDLPQLPPQVRASSISGHSSVNRQRRAVVCTNNNTEGKSIFYQNNQVPSSTYATPNKSISRQQKMRISSDDFMINGSMGQSRMIYGRSSSVLGQPLTSPNGACTFAPLCCYRSRVNLSAACTARCVNQPVMSPTGACCTTVQHQQKSRKYASNTMSAAPFPLSRTKAQSMDKLNLVNLNYAKFSTHNKKQTPSSSSTITASEKQQKHYSQTSGCTNRYQSAAANKRAAAANNINLLQQPSNSLQQQRRRLMMAAQSQQSLCCIQQQQQQQPLYHYATATRMISTATPQTASHSSRSKRIVSSTNISKQSGGANLIGGQICCRLDDGYAACCVGDANEHQVSSVCCSLDCTNQPNQQGNTQKRVALKKEARAMRQSSTYTSGGLLIGTSLQQEPTSYLSSDRYHYQQPTNQRLLKLCPISVAPPMAPPMPPPPPPPVVVHAAADLYKACHQKSLHSNSTQRDTRQRLTTFLASSTCNSSISNHPNGLSVGFKSTSAARGSLLGACSSEVSPNASISPSSSSSSPCSHLSSTSPLASSYSPTSSSLASTQQESSPPSSLLDHHHVYPHGYQVSGCSSSAANEHQNGAPVRLIGHHSKRTLDSANVDSTLPPVPPPLPAPDAEFEKKMNSILQCEQQSVTVVNRKHELDIAIAPSSGAQARHLSKLDHIGNQKSGKLSSRSLCFVDELKLLAKRQQQADVTPGNMSNNNSATLIKIINAAKQSTASIKGCSCQGAATCCQSKPCSRQQCEKRDKDKDANSQQSRKSGEQVCACCVVAKQHPTSAGKCGASKSSQLGKSKSSSSASNPHHESKSVKLLDFEQNKRRQHEMLMKEFKSAHSRMFSKRRSEEGDNTNLSDSPATSARSVEEETDSSKKTPTLASSMPIKLQPNAQASSLEQVPSTRNKAAAPAPPNRLLQGQQAQPLHLTVAN